jgi:hypothetical protein
MFGGEMGMMSEYTQSITSAGMSITQVEIIKPRFKPIPSVPITMSFICVQGRFIFDHSINWSKKGGA